MSRYKVVIDEPFMNCEHIYPIQQQKVKAMIEYLKGNNNVKSITIFGSSVNDRCHVGSDVDIYVELQQDEKIIHQYFPFVFDIFTNFSVDEHLKNEVNKYGVLVYSKD